MFANMSAGSVFQIGDCNASSALLGSEKFVQRVEQSAFP
jgi:hypothetical protein